MNRNERAARMREAADYLTRPGIRSRRDHAIARWLYATANRVAPEYGHGRNHSWSGSNDALRVADAILADKP